MKKEDVIYCAFCGAKNDVKDKKCKKCNKKLNPKNKLFREFLKDHVKDDVKSNLEDDIIGIITEWIKAHLFGIFFTAAVALLAVGVVVNENSLSNTKKKFATIKEINTKVEFKLTCDEKELKDQVRVCDSGYSLEGEKCIKKTNVSAKATKTCPNGYSLSGNKCISNATVEKQSKITCGTIPDYVYRRYNNNVYGTTIQNGKCYAKCCSAAAGTGDTFTESNCPSIFLMEIDSTTNYYCASYTDANGYCHNVANFTTKYSCDKGTLSGKNCVITETSESKLVCPDGFTYSDECKKCEKVK